MSSSHDELGNFISSKSRKCARNCSLRIYASDDGHIYRMLLCAIASIIMIFHSAFSTFRLLRIIETHKYSLARCKCTSLHKHSSISGYVSWARVFRCTEYTFAHCCYTHTLHTTVITFYPSNSIFLQLERMCEERFSVRHGIYHLGWSYSTVYRHYFQHSNGI